MTCVRILGFGKEHSDKFLRFPYCFLYIPNRVLQEPPFQIHQQAQIKFSKKGLFPLVKGLGKKCPLTIESLVAISTLAQSNTNKKILSCFPSIYTGQPRADLSCSLLALILWGQKVCLNPSLADITGGAGSCLSTPCLPEADGNSPASPPADTGRLSGQLALHPHSGTGSA